MKRPRRWLLPTLNLLVSLFAAILIYARWVEPNLIRVEKVRLPAALTGRGLDRIRVVHLADLHISREGPRERRLVRKVNALSPDLVFVTGDLAQFYTGTAAVRRVLSQLEARLGTFVVLGDADYSNKEDHCLYCHEEDRRTLLRDPPFRVLRNQSVTVMAASSRWVISGVDDEGGPCAGRFPPPPPESENADFRILLASSPLVLPQAGEQGYDLVLAGDTHGGQVRMPGLGPLYRSLASARYGFEGWAETNGSSMFINRGFGTSYLPLRFACPPLVACFEEASLSTGQ